jgi:hypothetical protein
MSAVASSKEIRILILRGTYNIVYIRISKILFYNDLYNFELAFQRRWFHLNTILELKVMLQILWLVQSLKFNPIQSNFDFQNLHFSL